MDLLILAGGSFAAGALVLALLAHVDRTRMDYSGSRLLWAFSLAGALSVLPGLVLYAVAEVVLPRGAGRVGELLFIWTVNAPVEEVSKYGCFVAMTLLLRSLREPQDGSLQGAATGLGFGLVENWLYGVAEGPGLFLLRTLVSLPGHVVYGALWGGYHGFESYQGRGRVRRWSTPLLALVPAIFAHALFNTLLAVRAPLELALVGDGLALALGAFLFLRLRALSPSQHRRPLREWRRAIPETEHALALNPQSVALRRRLAAYYLAANQPRLALSVLEPLDDEPWTAFYRQAAQRRIGPSVAELPPVADLNRALFLTLSGG